MKQIGFLSFGHWSDAPYSQVRSGVRCARSSRSSWPSPPRSSARTARTSASTTSPASSPRRSRSSPRSAPGPAASRSAPPSSTCATRTRCTWPRTPGRRTSSPAAGSSSGSAAGRRSRSSTGSAPSATCRRRARPTPTWPAATRASSSTCCSGEGFAEPNPRPMFPNPPGLLRLEPHSPGLRDRIWWGAATDATAVWAAELGMNLQSSTLKFDETGEPLHVQQRKQIEAYREAWKAAGHEREPRVSVSRSIFALVDDRDRAYFGHETNDQDSIGYLDRADAGDLRAVLRRRARRAGQAARRGRGDPGRRHAAADGARTSSASSTTPTPSRASCSTSRPDLGWR